MDNSFEEKTTAEILHELVSIRKKKAEFEPLKEKALSVFKPRATRKMISEVIDVWKQLYDKNYLSKKGSGEENFYKTYKDLIQKEIDLEQFRERLQRARLSLERKSRKLDIKIGKRKKALRRRFNQFLRDKEAKGEMNKTLLNLLNSREVKDIIMEFLEY